MRFSLDRYHDGCLRNIAQASLCNFGLLCNLCYQLFVFLFIDRASLSLKFLLDDPYALEALGELIFYDDYLYDMYKTVASEAKDKSKGKKKKKKKD